MTNRAKAMVAMMSFVVVGGLAGCTTQSKCVRTDYVATKVTETQSRRVLMCFHADGSLSWKLEGDDQ